MARLTHYGSVYGQIPSFSGRIFYVAPGASGGGTGKTATYAVNGQSFPASDTNDGLSPERALASVGQALTLVQTPTSMSSPSTGTSTAAGSFDDVIVLLPGTHNVDANSTTGALVTKGRLLITGVPGTNDIANGLPPVWGQRTRVQCSISDHVFNVSANDVEFAFLDIKPTTAKVGIITPATQARINIHDCVVNALGVTLSTATKGFNIAACTLSTIQRCTFLTSTALGPMVDLTGAIDTALLGCRFLHKANTIAVLVQCGAAQNTTEIGDNVFTATDTGVVTVGVDGTGTTLVAGVHAFRNYFNSVGTVMPSPFKNFGTNTFINLTNNYQGSVGAGAGGALITTAI